MQTTLYLGAALLVLLVIIGGFRLIVRRDYLEKGKLTPLSVITEWIIILSWVAFTNAYLPRDWPDIHMGEGFQWVGWPLLILGMVGTLFCLGWLGLKRSHGMETNKLIRSGPYRFMRNPQIVSFGMGMIGFTLLWPSWHLLLSLLLYAALAHTMVMTEEEHLLEQYGEEYRQYCGEVPRYFIV